MDGLHHFGKTGLYIISASKSRFLAQSIYGDVAIRAEINAFFFFFLVWGVFYNSTNLSKELLSSEHF